MTGMGWIIDSGASQHLSHDRMQFLTYKDVTPGLTITIADGTKIHTRGIGDIKVLTESGEIMLTEVWHVPNIGASLISVARMVDAGYKVEFEKSKCYLSNNGIRSELGSRHGSLYYLAPNIESLGQNGNHPPGPQANLGLTTNQSSSATLGTWHRRLCHRTLDTASVRYISGKVTDMKISNTTQSQATICGICALGRQHKEAGTGTREKASDILNVILSDLCGPMQTLCLTGEKYFITFIDEASGRVSISLLRTKDGALTAFQAYRAHAEKPSRKEILSLRSDGGGEYMSKEFRKYLADSRIQHIVSPAYSPSQNGRAARMNRTIMGSARCVLEDLKLRKEFWGYAVLAAAHIHNRLPSRTHNDLSPLQHWTGKEPGICHLRIFRSTAWVHIPKEK